MARLLSLQEKDIIRDVLGRAGHPIINIQEHVASPDGGRGGGWKLTRSLDQVTVLDVQRALTKGPAFAAPVSRNHPTCPVERASNAVLEKAQAAAEAHLIAKYAATALAQIATDAKHKASGTSQ